MLKTLTKKIRILHKKSEQLKIIYTYRYLSWAITSIFYLLSQPYSVILLKLGVVLSLLGSAIIITSLYEIYRENNQAIGVFVFIETLGIVFLLIPSGGLKSPFMWYALNPVLIAASFLPFYISWLDLLVYLTFSTFTSFVLFNPSNKNLFTLITESKDLILIFILIVLAVQMLAKLSKELQKQRDELLEVNKQLKVANLKTKESMDHIMSLYQAIEAFTILDEKGNLIQTFADYIFKLTKTSFSFFWLKPEKGIKGHISISGNIDGNNVDKIRGYIEKNWIELKTSESPISIEVMNYCFLCFVVKSASREYGLIGIKVDKSQPNENMKQNIKLLNFLSELSSVILERFHLEQVSKKLMIIEEQNRIANEMHDSVSQKLFSISCAIHVMMTNWDKMTQEQIKEQLELIHKCSNIAKKELRTTIYKLSSLKSKEKSFELEIKEHINSISKLNGIDIKLHVEGSIEGLSCVIKKVLYRIISEACSNSIRHGKCSEIEIRFNVDDSIINLIIIDNGIGFDVNKLNKKRSIGLGLTNIKNLVRLYKGKLEIYSKALKGTKINITIPNEKTSKIGGLVI